MTTPSEETPSEDVNLGNPVNERRDAAEQNEAKVTRAVERRRAVKGADDLFDDTVASPEKRVGPPNPMEETPLRTPEVGEIPPTVTSAPSGAAVSTHEVTVPPVVQAPVAGTMPRRAEPEDSPVADMHAIRVDDPDVEMKGDLTNKHDVLSGESGTHPVGVGVGAGVGGAAVGAATGLVAGAVAGPLGAALGTVAGTVIGAFAGGYAGKGIAESVHPTTEDHYWRSAYSHRPYVGKGAKYEEWEPAYAYGVRMRERLMDQTWEEAETVLRVGWEESQESLVMGWDRARPAVLDAWDRLTPEPGEEEVSEQEKMRDE